MSPSIGLSSCLFGPLSVDCTHSQKFVFAFRTNSFISGKPGRLRGIKELVKNYGTR
jgi:hypothetical protein